MSTDLVYVTNKLIRAWVEADEATYRSVCSTSLKMTIPAYGVDVTGVDAAWGIRQTMPKPLWPHTVDSHSFTSSNVVLAYVHAFDPTSGARIQLSEVTFTFDASGIITHYHQENIFAKKTPSGTAEIYYYPGRGRGEQCRLALAEAGIPFEEKFTGAETDNGVAIFGGLPILKYDGVHIAQGCNIVQYIATKGGFAGKSDEEKAEVNQFILSAEDLRPAVAGVIFMGGDKEKCLDGPVKKWFTKWNQLLEGKEYFVGDSFTAADLSVYEIAETAAVGIGAPIDEYPNLKALVVRVGARPKIEAYTKTRKW